MWNLNDSPDRAERRPGEESEGCSTPKTSDDDAVADARGKRVGSMSNSSSSAVVIEDGSDDEEGLAAAAKAHRKRSSKIFGFSVTREEDGDRDEGEDDPGSRHRVTRQFFPVEEEDEEEELEENGGRAGMGAAVQAGFPRAHWVGVRFCQSDHHPIGTGKGSPVLEGSQPMKKSRRGPRSRSSQYRGVTFYRRTGRWESHIWFVILKFIYFFSW